MLKLNKKKKIKKNVDNRLDILNNTHRSSFFLREKAAVVFASITKAFSSRTNAQRFCLIYYLGVELSKKLYYGSFIVFSDIVEK